ncbi:hypothetical protein EXW72_06070 [Pseudomonas sp. BCA14]|nr:hypothetical protein EXW70_06420 [Pseudomonas sp. JMN1]TFF15171.1 hypothetical protein EXW71_02620 [Pseudomonas sp. BCA17]TFF31578.1 hypothetical protein EXW72_06070 [Pseudomonas sp. BCA14]TFF32531.1 hypothetical protein EXW73_01870 [Pseudomonas sp. BCA13]
MQPGPRRRGCGSRGIRGFRAGSSGSRVKGSQKAADYTDRAADHQSRGLMCINMTPGGQQL